MAAISTDFAFHCPGAVLSNDSHAAGIPSWRYYFNATFANTQIFPGAGVFHSSEISLVFGTYPQVNATAEEKNLSQYMQTAWARFAKSPSTGPGWAEVPSVADLGTGGVLNTTTTAGALDQKCSLYRPYYNALGIAVPGNGGG